MTSGSARRWSHQVVFEMTLATSLRSSLAPRARAPSPERVVGGPRARPGSPPPRRAPPPWSRSAAPLASLLPMTTRPLDVSSGPLAPPSRLSRLGALSLATRTLALRWRAFASLRPGLAPLLALLARALLASALLLLLARLPARTPERWRWKPAAASARVYSGALALVVPFLILSALAAARPRRLIAPPKTHEIEIVGLGEAVRERGASRREGRRKRMDDAEGGKGAAGSEGGRAEGEGGGFFVRFSFGRLGRARRRRRR